MKGELFMEGIKFDKVAKGLEELFEWRMGRRQIYSCYKNGKDV